MRDRIQKMHEKVEFELSGRRVWVAGHSGMVGGATVARLRSENCEIVTTTRAKADLRNAAQVEGTFDRLRPDVVVIAAARVGGILANDTYPAEFLTDNLLIATNLIAGAARHGVEKLLFLGSSCIYPREAAQPIREDALLTGPLEPTNQWYALAKIAGIMQCQAFRRQYGCDFISAMPCNLYGPGDNFDTAAGHVIPALMVKAHRARMEGRGSLDVWGSGRPLREFLYVNDLADAVVFLLKHYSREAPINVGTGKEISIADLSRTICRVVGLDAELRFDASLPDGTPRKVMDVGRIRQLGWQARTPLVNGLEQTYRWYLDHRNATETRQFA